MKARKFKKIRELIALYESIKKEICLETYSGLELSFFPLKGKRDILVGIPSSRILLLYLVKQKIVSSFDETVDKRDKNFSLWERVFSFPERYDYARCLSELTHAWDQIRLLDIMIQKEREKKEIPRHYCLVVFNNLPYWAVRR